MKIKNKIYKEIEILVNYKEVAYKKSLKVMEKRVIDIKNGRAKELIWFLEHISIYTSGRGYIENKKVINNIPVYNTNRGGKITWHGPGQKIIYIVLNLKKRQIDIRKFVFNLEEFIIQSLKEVNIDCFRKTKHIGIWTINKEGDEAKIASLGLRVSKGIIYHGMSINFNCDLTNFYQINPCGINNAIVTSVNNLNKNIQSNYLDNILQKNVSLFI